MPAVPSLGGAGDQQGQRVEGTRQHLLEAPGRGGKTLALTLTLTLTLALTLALTLTRSDTKRNANVSRGCTLRVAFGVGPGMLYSVPELLIAPSHCAL